MFFAYAKMFPHTTSIVIVPLTSLIVDLVRRAHSLGLTACSDIGDLRPLPSLLFLTPDAAWGSRGVIARLYADKALGRLFLDEAHVYSLDADFRPLLRHLVAVNPFDNPWTLLTGTLTEYILNDLRKNFFQLKKMVVIRASTYRSNIRYEQSSTASLSRLRDEVRATMRSLENGEKIIIYAGTKPLITSISSILSEIPHVIYHADLTGQEKTVNFERWSKEDDISLMIATCAFGLGVDYPSVRCVVNYGLPYSLEDYVQQSGRAGRDNKPARSLLMYNAEELDDPRLVESEKFASMKEYLLRGADCCRRRLLSIYFDEKEFACCYLDGCSYCDVCTRYFGSCTSNQLHSPVVVAPSESFSFAPTYAPLVIASPVERPNPTQTLLSQSFEFGTKILKYMKCFKKYCILCFLRNQQLEAHMVRDCPLKSIRGCHDCASEAHFAFACPFRTAMIKNHLPYGICQACLLPADFVDVRLHTQNEMGYKQCPHAVNAIKLFGILVAKYETAADLCVMSPHGSPCLDVVERFVSYMSVKVGHITSTGEL